MDLGLQPFLTAAPYEGESLSHFLGRIRRVNHLTPNGLGKLAGIGAVVARWERFHLNPYPTHAQFEKLGQLLGIESKRLWAMLPAQGEAMQFEPIRLCGACYGESPCYRIEWQYQSVWKCDRHQLKLLSTCPKCGAKFKSPASWEEGRCSRCHSDFEMLAGFQKLT